MPCRGFFLTYVALFDVRKLVDVCLSSCASLQSDLYAQPPAKFLGLHSKLDIYVLCCVCVIGHVGLVAIVMSTQHNPCAQVLFIMHDPAHARRPLTEPRAFFFFFGVQSHP